MDTQPPSPAERAERKRNMLAEKMAALGFEPGQIDILNKLNAQREAWGPQAYEYVNERVMQWYKDLPQKHPDAYEHALVHAMYGSTAFQGVTKFDLPGEDSVLKFADLLESEMKEKHLLPTQARGA